MVSLPVDSEKPSFVAATAQGNIFIERFPGEGELSKIVGRVGILVDKPQGVCTGEFEQLLGTPSNRATMVTLSSGR